MRKLICLLSIIVFSCPILIAQGVNYEWAKTYGNGGDGEFRNLTIDNSGNIISVGSFSGSIDFDPGPSTANVSIGGSADDGYIQKLDSNGNFLWVTAYFAPTGAVQDVRCTDVTTDDSNNIYVVGSFIGTVDFDYGPGVVSVSSVNQDMFILKLDSLGDFIWVKTMGAAGATHFLTDIQYDIDGYIYSMGFHGGTFDIDPGPGVINLDGVSTFIQKLDLDGDFIWAKQFKGDSLLTGDPRGKSFTIDSLHNIYCTGYFQNTVDFDPGINVYNLSSNGLRDCFAVKIDSLGNFKWAIAFGGSIQDESNSIALDPFDGVYICGQYMTTVDFNPGSPILNHTSNDERDAFVMKLDTTGSFNWVKTFGQTFVDVAYSISTDSSGNSYTSGAFSDTVDFDPDAGIFNLIADTAAMMFILKLDSSGGFSWAKDFDGTLLQIGTTILTDFTSDDILVGGRFIQFIDLDPGPDTALFVAPKHNFLLKLSQCALSYGTDSVSVCESYTWIDGITYTADNNTATSVLENASATGCDSIVSLDLTIKQSSTATDVLTACDSLIWSNGVTYYTNNTTATDTFLNAAGCDSVVTLNLTVTNFNTSITLQGITITANASGVNYQWLDCINNFAAIPGATNASYTASVNGSYAVEISNNGCADTSICTVIDDLGILESLNPKLIHIYPNPSDGKINIENNGGDQFDLHIYSFDGSLVYEDYDISDEYFTFQLNVESGMYIVEVQKKEGIFMGKLMIK